MGKREKQKKMSGADILHLVLTFFQCVADYGCCIYSALLLFVMPLYYTDGFSHIGSDKALFFRNLNRNMGKILIPVGIVLVLLKIILRRLVSEPDLKEKWALERRKFSLTDWFVAAYGVCVTISYLLSDYQEMAWYGAERGWFMGFCTQIALVGIYFFMSRFWKPRKWMLWGILPISAIVFFLGYLDRFGMPLLEMKSRSASFISTIGNINWYCGYVITVLFLGVLLFWGNGAKGWAQKILLGLYVLLGFATLITQGSESGTVALAVTMLALFWFSAGDGEQMRNFWLEMILFSAACLVSQLLRSLRGEQMALIEGQGQTLQLFTTGLLPGIFFVISIGMWWLVHNSLQKRRYPQKLFTGIARGIAVAGGAFLLIFVGLIAANTKNPGCIGALSGYSVFTFSPGWGSNRGATWTGAWMCFGEQNFLHKLFGVGPDAMSGYLYQDGSRKLQLLMEETFGASLVLTNAHNEWLTVLVDTGILGLISYAGIFVSAIVSFLKKEKGGKQEPLVLAAGFCMLAYTVNNMFSFQQTMNVTTMFMILGMAEGIAKNRAENKKPVSR